MPKQVKMTIIEPDGTEFSLWTIKGKTVWEAMEIMGWDTKGACGGQGTCSQCKFRMDGGISELSPAERERLIPDEISSGQRLACLTTVEDDFTLHIDYWPSESNYKTNLLYYRPKEVDNLGVATKSFFIAGREQESPLPVYDRIKEALVGYKIELDNDNINHLARLDRQGRPTLELHGIILDEARVIHVGRQRPTVLGLAVDIGSTSLFAALLDLETGQTVAMTSHSNMQRIYGDDIISRVQYANTHEDGAVSLQRILINNLNSMIEEMLTEIKADPFDIYKVTAVGNPVMLHLFLGYSTTGFGTAPYVGVFSDELQLPVSQLDLKVNPGGILSILPQLGGFIGADATACLLTLWPLRQHTFLLIDIGTNGEVVLNHGGKMWAASAAAGPAFEGGAISCGMRAGQGAIDKVSWNDDRLIYRVIGGGAARGICGSGIIDLVSVLLENNLIDRNGAFTERAYQVFDLKIGPRGAEMILPDLLTTTPVVFNQEDIRQVQLARSAIRTAIDHIMRSAGVTAFDLEHVFLAGSFGNYVDRASIINIGLIPGVKPDQISNIGNAAAEGAILALLSNEYLQKASMIKSKVNCVELTEQKDFQAVFLENLNF